MVIFLISKEVYQLMKPIVESGLHPIWTTSDVLSEVELQALRNTGIEVSDFNYSLSPSDSEGIKGALLTISEHHPGQSIILEQRCEF